MPDLPDNLSDIISLLPPIPWGPPPEHKWTEEEIRQIAREEALKVLQSHQSHTPWNYTPKECGNG
jgi:hypothetical protein